MHAHAGKHAVHTAAQAFRCQSPCIDASAVSFAWSKNMLYLGHSDVLEALNALRIAGVACGAMASLAPATLTCTQTDA